MSTPRVRADVQHEIDAMRPDDVPPLHRDVPAVREPGQIVAAVPQGSADDLLEVQGSSLSFGQAKALASGRF